MLSERAPHFSIQVKGKKWFDLLKFTLQLMFLICEMRRSARSMCWGRGVATEAALPSEVSGPPVRTPDQVRTPLGTCQKRRSPGPIQTQRVRNSGAGPRSLC